MHKQIKKANEFLFISIVSTFLLLVFAPASAATSLAGCGTNVPKDYDGTFVEDDFKPYNVSFEDDRIVLDTGADSINPNSIVIPFEQEVSVTFLYDGAGYVSDFGYVLKADTVDADGNFLGWPNIPDEDRHPIFTNIQDGGTSGGNGVFDYLPSTETAVEAYDDGTSYPFATNGDDDLTTVDMKKNLGTMAAGTELIFFLTANQDWDTDNTVRVFFTKTNWNPDTYSGNYSGFKFTTESAGEEITITPSGEDSITQSDISFNNLTITRGSGSFVDNGFTADQTITINGANQSLNNGTFYVKTVSAQTLTIYEEFYRVFDLGEGNEGTCGSSGTLSTFDCSTCDAYYHMWMPEFSSDCDSCKKYYSCGWLASKAVTRLSEDFNLTLQGNYCLNITRGETYPHVMVGAPSDKPDAWILGWEDLQGGGDTDFNDMAFWIHRQNGGSITLKSDAELNSNPLKPVENGAYFTSVKLEVYDHMPCNDANENGIKDEGEVATTIIKYYVSINGGIDWIEIENDDWDTVKEIKVDADGDPIKKDTDGDTLCSELFCNNDPYNDDPCTDEICLPCNSTDDEYESCNCTVSNWSYGFPAYTYRSATIDFAAFGMVGDELLWKSELLTNDEECIPEIFDVKIDGSVALNNNFSRAAPVVKTNILYSGSYETPAIGWGDKSILRGHLLAEMIYDPEDPSATLSCNDADGDPISPVPFYCPYVWDAGVELNSKSPDENASGSSKRTIYYPDIQITQITDEVIGTGDGMTRKFTGTLAHAPISYGSIEMTDSIEKFKDKGIRILYGSDSGTGTINRTTGEYTIEFTVAPNDEQPITALYAYYDTYDLKEFTTTNITNTMLGLDNTMITGTPDYYKYDLNEDDAYTEADGDLLVKWVRGYNKDGSTQKEWMLGPIDHSVPALLTPPAFYPFWWFSAEISETEIEAYNTFTARYNYQAEVEDDTSTTEIDEYAAEHEARRSVLFAGSRSGMLHAFDAGNFRWGDNPATTAKEYRGYFVKGDDGTYDYGTGEELWAFIPTNLISRFKNNFMNASDQAYVDASPAIADIYTGTEWKSVVLFAQGNGGDTVCCLDVTNPLLPTFMWEFSDPDLYRSSSSPSVAAIGRLMSAESGLSIWAAFFVSGQVPDTADPSIYVVDIATGSLIQKVILNAAGDPGKGGIPSGQPALIDSDDNGFIDRAYIGTDKGYLYKLNIPDTTDASNPQINHCVLNDSTNTTYFKPIYATPALLNKTSKYFENDDFKYHYDIKIFFGTGDSKSSDDYNGPYYFLAYSDQDEKDECSAITSPEWSLELPAGEKIWASAFASAGQIYFGTSTAETEDPCEGYSDGTNNGGSVYSVNADDGAIDFSQVVGDIITPPMVFDEHLYIKTTDTSKVKSYGGPNYNNENTTKKITGTPATVRSWKEINDLNTTPVQCPVED